jgi:hypothetical protein
MLATVITKPYKCIRCGYEGIPAMSCPKCGTSSLYLPKTNSPMVAMATGIPLKELPRDIKLEAGQKYLVRLGHPNIKIEPPVVKGDILTILAVSGPRDDRIVTDRPASVPAERHEIKAIGAEGRALRAEGYLSYFKQRIFAGLGVSAIDMGEGDTSNRSTHRLLNISGNIIWDRPEFDIHIRLGDFMLMEDNGEVPNSAKPEEPKNNGSRETCYWCKQPTEYMFGTLRICRRCGK